MTDRTFTWDRMLGWATRPRTSSVRHARSTGPKRLNLALQGGGAHGAFTWGVLDRLLADGRIAVDGLSGTSAGAVNAVMLADGLLRGGPKEARHRLADFWRAASTGGNLPELQRLVVERLFPFMPANGTPAGLWLAAVSQVLAPQHLNPLNINPLKDLIGRFVDFDALRASDLGLFIAATNVATGELRVFTRAEISAEAVMASACLPMLFRAVEIDGVPYWDGGYTANPVLSPFLRSTATEDVLLVQVTPLQRRTVPSTPRDIMHRVNEISLNASLMAELRAIDLAGRLIDEGSLPRGTGAGEYRRLRLHRIVLEDPSDQLIGSKFNTSFEFFEKLRDLGQRAASRFLDTRFDDIGVRATLDLDAEAAAA